MPGNFELGSFRSKFRKIFATKGCIDLGKFKNKFHFAEIHLCNNIIPLRISFFRVVLKKIENYGAREALSNLKNAVKRGSTRLRPLQF